MKALLTLVLVLVLCGCAGTPSPLDSRYDESRTAAQTLANPLAVYDPWEPFNRKMYRFNAWFDAYVMLPALHGYHAVTPKFVRSGVANFFSNIGEITTLLNTILQGKVVDSAATASRFVINTTVGLAGFFDPATHMGIAKRKEDFGQTLGVYGVKTGPYLVLPFFGPSSLRDSVGRVADRYAFHELDVLQLKGHDKILAAYLLLSFINMRDQVDFRYYQTGSPFEYTLVRYIYLNYRALEVSR